MELVQIMHRRVLRKWLLFMLPTAISGLRVTSSPNLLRVVAIISSDGDTWGLWRGIYCTV